MFNIGTGKEGEEDEGGPQVSRRPASSTRASAGSTELTSHDGVDNELDVEAGTAFAENSIKEQALKVTSKLLDEPDIGNNHQLQLTRRQKKKLKNSLKATKKID
ncbi:hypothetical protein NDU88_005396 [Pleurodeles waltl]|uniref:Uncharacterized protein n=1 Tax=Pleurodeles waltl TaxID=8319 RepID=A0AAV7TU58_PLEWA|nr:hypothetical protein NDU88_005396 [Pleurodeles waltl]